MFNEKYRPLKLEDLVGLEQFKIKAESYLKEGEIPNLLLSGSPGTGKTSVAYIMAKSLLGDHHNSNFHQFNASKDRGIDILRNEITTICKARPVGVKHRIVLMDEADYLTNEAQACFRGLLEQYQNVVRFIFTCNYSTKLISPLHSRLTTFEFKRPEVKELGMFLKKISQIEKLNFDDKDLVSIARKSNGDIRTALNLLESISSSDVGVINELEKVTLKEIKSWNKKERIEWSFKFDPEMLFISLWEKVKLEQDWNLVQKFAEANFRMSSCYFKQPIISNLVSEL